MPEVRVEYDQAKDQRCNIWRVTSDGVCLALACGCERLTTEFRAQMARTAAASFKAMA